MNQSKKHPILIKKKNSSGLKGGKKPEDYSKLSDIQSDKHTTKYKNLEDEQMKKAMENSMVSNLKPKFQDKRDKTVKRKVNQKFIGMANLGNTCYFNSMMQILFFSDCFAEKICQFNADLTLISKTNEKEMTEDQIQKQKMKKVFLKNGVNLIQEIQKMFGQMLKGHINYANPQGVLAHLMEKMTNRKVEVGLQKDLVEFLGLFFECLEAGFSVDESVGLLTEESEAGSLDQYIPGKAYFFYKFRRIGEEYFEK